jgi:hypothetical protein
MHALQVRIPTEEDGSPVKITIEVWVQSIAGINDITADFQLDIYISEYWRDPLLKYDYMEPCNRNMTLGRRGTGEARTHTQARAFWSKCGRRTRVS